MKKTKIPEVYFIPMFYYHSDRKQMKQYFKKDLFDSLDNAIIRGLNRKLINKIKSIFTNPDPNKIKGCFNILEKTNEIIKNGNPSEIDKFLNQTKYNIISVKIENDNEDAKIVSLKEQLIDIFDILCSQKLFFLLLEYGKKYPIKYKKMEKNKKKKLLHYLFEMCDDVGNASFGFFAKGTRRNIKIVTQLCVNNLKKIYGNDWVNYVSECNVELIKISICKKFNDRCPLTTTLYEYIRSL